MCLKRSRSQEQDGERGAGPASFVDGFRQMHGEEQPIRQAGELIVMREVIEVLLLLRATALRSSGAGMTSFVVKARTVLAIADDPDDCR